MICQHKGEQPEDGWLTDFRADFSTVSAAGSIEGVWVQVAITDSKGREARILITEEEALHLYRLAIETRAIERSQSEGAAARTVCSTAIPNRIKLPPSSRSVR